MAGNNGRRVLIHVITVEERRIRLSVPQWSTEQSIYIPRSSLPPELRENVKEGQWLFATGNIQTPQASRLNLRNFEEAPVPDPNDGLA
jgi:hypothetical protein